MGTKGSKTDQNEEQAVKLMKEKLTHSDILLISAVFREKDIDKVREVCEMLNDDHKMFYTHVLDMAIHDGQLDEIVKYMCSRSLASVEDNYDTYIETAIKRSTVNTKHEISRESSLELVKFLVNLPGVRKRHVATKSRDTAILYGMGEIEYFINGFVENGLNGPSNCLTVHTGDG